MPRPGPGHARLLEDVHLRRWHQNVSQGSLITADVYLRRLGAFCLQTGLSPQGMLSLDEVELHGRLIDFVALERQRGRAGSYIHSTLKSVRSWLGHNGIRILRPVKVKGSQLAPTLIDERVPTPQELGRILELASPQERVCLVLMAHGGLRPEVIGNYTGKDGLRIADLPELECRGKKVAFSQSPSLLQVRPELSKTGNRYFTFLSSQGSSYLTRYLEERLSKGEELAPTSDLVTPVAWNKSFLRSTNVSDAVRRAIRRAGFSFRPYVLRAFFDTQLLLAESRGEVLHDYRVFWMGHKGSMEARYTTNKGRLPTELVEDIRWAYRRCEHHLSDQVSLQGLAAVSKMKLDRALPSDHGNRFDPPIQISETPMGPSTETRPPLRRTQRLVRTEEVPGFLQDGWTVILAVDRHRVVMESPD